MVATEPLANDVLATINWQNRPTFNDGGRMIIYAQLTADNRIAFGGRGAPYHFGSRIADEFDLDDHTHLRIADSIARHFPAAEGAKITHRWGGPLGVPRDWTPTVIVDREAGYARLGGYTGDGVAATNLLARLTVDRLVERDSVLTGLPFNDHQSPRWEIEPLRYLGINLLLKLSESIDRYEERYAKAPRIRSKVFDALL
jgi:glycine/D-amino acid oxidase-like deaminating enzyme